jgi:hypothetical protein
MKSKKGQVSNFVYMAVAVILGIGLAVPITKSVVSTSNLTGIDAVIAGFLSTLIIVGVLMGIVYGTIVRK